MGLALSDIKDLIETPQKFGFKIERKKRKPRDLVDKVKENGIRIDNLWIECDRENGECVVVDDSNKLFIINFNNKIIIMF
ncbi:hypothetical protein BFU36_08535 [Sulfolobus sp. A20]|uniref:hypothetical protein n=1 Tax=Saccharolobus sp. A20 TaxID=1891280 RepID=UPI0008461B83|nr:hypothetical protein [Sulfolobus sp. A20]TRM74658.1 hypothetical protein DJ532_12265 [Sulfolobus sp. A20-N-F8]TRM75972.1 hypothetical protein DJ528_08885 [Sulfolobus sp. B5]TRM86732.1 hypothetical protein DJ529_10530 [Sulfolobus sp. C3]TRM92009.1 hypothetical protein DJ526_06415 [Sulfolobus sp. A20-N-G8]TRM98403.1 hypothetical protein DJ530_10925 [Sulfolobus sp. E1]TRN00914.1 hypothetical protein DJ527_06420 [Sulfolobus sp. F1]